MWCGVVWCGVVWCGVVWCGVVWCGVVWCGVVWCGVACSLSLQFVHEAFIKRGIIPRTAPQDYVTYVTLLRQKAADMMQQHTEW